MGGQLRDADQKKKVVMNRWLSFRGGAKRSQCTHATHRRARTHTLATAAPANLMSLGGIEGGWGVGAGGDLSKK